MIYWHSKALVFKHIYWYINHNQQQSRRSVDRMQRKSSAHGYLWENKKKARPSHDLLYDYCNYFWFSFVFKPLISPFCLANSLTKSSMERNHQKQVYDKIRICISFDALRLILLPILPIDLNALRIVLYQRLQNHCGWVCFIQ